MLGKELNIRPYLHASHLEHRSHAFRDTTPLSTQNNTEDPTTWHPQLGCEHEEYPQKFHTGFGTLTFEELYKKTQRIVGGTLRNRFGMENPEDIDDCMQAGYLKVWQQLQKKS